MNRLNCWEIKECKNYKCPAFTDYKANGINSGKRGGRICWAVAGTFCGGEKQGTFAQKRNNCMTCEVYGIVKKEECTSFRLLLP